jgi:1-deoxyxylulose-5-phosphate synthase
MQPQYNLIYREEEREMLPLCRDQRIGVIPWSPLARGFLAGNRTRTGGSTSRAQGDQVAKQIYYTDDDFAVAERLAEVAQDRGAPPMQVALAWILAKDAVTAPIIGASKPGHLEDALAALALRLTPEETARLEEPYRPHRVLGHQ